MTDEIPSYELDEELRAKARAIVEDDGPFSKYAENLLKNEDRD